MVNLYYKRFYYVYAYIYRICIKSYINRDRFIHHRVLALYLSFDIQNQFIRNNSLSHVSNMSAVGLNLWLPPTISAFRD